MDDRQIPLKKRFTTILITGAGAPGTAGTKEALKQLPFPYRLVGIDIDAQAIGHRLFDAFYVVPKPDMAEFTEELLTIVEREKVSLILPQVAEELAALAANKERFAQLGCHVLVNDLDKIKILNDKHLLMKSLRRWGLPVPRFHLAKTKDDLKEAAHQLGYPSKSVAVKPPLASGKRGMRILTESFGFLDKKPDAAECPLRSFLAIFPNETIPPLLVCEYLPGKEFSVDCLCKNGRSVLILPRTRDKVRTGITFAGRAIQESAIISQCRTVIEKLGLSHMIGFQFKYNKKDCPVMIECNPRIQGTMVLGAFCGANVIAGAVCQALGLPFEDTQANIEWGVGLFRHWGATVHDGEGNVIRKF